MFIQWKKVRPDNAWTLKEECSDKCGCIVGIAANFTGITVRYVASGVTQQ